MRTLHIRSEEELPEVAAALLDELGDRRVVVLRGEMGAGKTTLVRAVAEALGVSDQVTSPTFALVNHYRGRAGQSVYHFDFYRVEALSEAYDLGYEEYFYSGDLCLVEWPEKIEELLPPDVMTVTIEVDSDEERTITIY